MENVYFGRDYQIIVGRPTELTSFIIPKNIVSPTLVNQGTNGVSPSGFLQNRPIKGLDDLQGFLKQPRGDYVDYNSIPAEFYEIRDFQMKANISHGKTSSFPCSIELDNLPSDFLNRLRIDDIIILRAHYRTTDGDYIQAAAGLGRLDLPDLFVGQVAQVVTSHDGKTQKTVIKGSETQTVRKNSRISRSWPPATTRIKVLRDLIQMMKTQGVPLGRFSLTEANTQEWAIANSVLLSGLTLKGFLQEELSKFASSIGLRVYTVTGKLYIESKYAPQGLQQFTVTPANVKGRVGLISSSIAQKSNTDNKAGSTGIQFTVHLEPELGPDKVVVLEGFPDGLDGEYEVNTTQHDLDFRSNNKWDTKVTATRIQ